MSTLAFDTQAIKQAERPEDLFGTLFGTARECRELLEGTYHDLATVAAGDAVAESHLEDLYLKAKSGLRRGGYGRGAAFSQPLVFKGERAAWRVVESLEDGEFGQLLRVESELGLGLAKLAHDKKEQPLLEHEALMLSALHGPEAVESRLKGYVPELLDSFEHGERAGCVYRQIDNLYTLVEVRAAYPAGVPWLDAIWIMRRLLVAIGYAHANGIVHLNVLPEHIAIEPEGHGLVLRDWEHSLCQPIVGREVHMIEEGYEDWYPPEFAARLEGAPQSDIFLAARSFQYLLGADAPAFIVPNSVPERLKAWLNACAAANSHSRPEDAWELLAEFDELIGERDFKPFVMPAVPTDAVTTTDNNNQRPATGPKGASDG